MTKFSNYSLLVSFPSSFPGDPAKKQTETLNQFLIITFRRKFGVYLIHFCYRGKLIYVMLCTIWYHLYNLKTVNNTHGGVLLFVKLQALACNFPYECQITMLKVIISTFVNQKQQNNLLWPLYKTAIQQPTSK